MLGFVRVGVMGSLCPLLDVGRIHVELGTANISPLEAKASGQLGVFQAENGV